MVIREMESAYVVYFGRMLDSETVKVVGAVQFENMNAIPFKRAVIVSAPFINAKTVNVAIKDELRDFIEMNILKAKSFEFIGSVEGMTE